MPDRDPCLWAGTLTWLFHVREQAAAAFVAAVMAFLRGRYQGTRLHKTLLDAMMCALIAWFIRDSLGALDIDNDFSYLGSIIVGYLGTDYLGALLRRLLGKKSGLEPDPCKSVNKDGD